MRKPAMLLGLVAVLGYFFRSGLLRPLEEVEKALSALGRGDLERRIPESAVLGPASPGANDELRMLVHAFNRTVDEATAELLATPGLFIEAIVAPDFAAGAVGVLTTKPKWRANVRLMQVGLLDSAPAARQLRFVEGGMLAT